MCRTFDRRSWQLRNQEQSRSFLSYISSRFFLDDFALPRPQFLFHEQGYVGLDITWLRLNSSRSTCCRCRRVIHKNSTPNYEGISQRKDQRIVALVETWKRSKIRSWSVKKTESRKGGHRDSDTANVTEPPPQDLYQETWNREVLTWHHHLRAGLGTIIWCVVGTYYQAI